jgi:hypothetical protein
MKIFYAEISYRTIGDDIWALYPQIWPTSAERNVGETMKIFYVEISYRTMGWLNLGDDIWALYPQIWPTWPTPF